MIFCSRPVPRPASKAHPHTQVRNSLQWGRPGLLAGLSSLRVWHCLLGEAAVQPDAKLLWGQQRAASPRALPAHLQAGGWTGVSGGPGREHDTMFWALQDRQLRGGRLPLGTLTGLSPRHAWTLAIRSLKAGRQLSLTTAGLLPGQALSWVSSPRSARSPSPQEVLEFRVGGLPGEGGGSRQPGPLGGSPICCHEATASSGGRVLGADSPDSALELDPGQQHGEGDVVLMQHAWARSG